MGAKSTGWKELGDDLHTASGQVVDEGKKIVSKGCLNIKRQAQGIVRANSHRGYLPQYPSAITYDVTTQATDIAGEVGPDKDEAQGPLGNLVEFGSINNAPIPHLSPSLDAELPKFERHVADLGEALLSGDKPTGGVDAASG